MAMIYNQNPMPGDIPGGSWDTSITGEGNFANTLFIQSSSNYGGSGGAITFSLSPNVTGLLTYEITWSIAEFGSGFAGMENPAGSMGDFTLQGSLSVTANGNYYVTTIRPDLLPDSYTFVTGLFYVTPS